jgi:APA family basic amino acid/polyamine antiporter
MVLVASPLEKGGETLSVEIRKPATKMGFWAVLAFVLSSQVGAGVFFFPCKMAFFGVPGLLSWGMAGTGALLLAFVFIRLCRTSSHTSGPHTFVLETFGPSAGFYVAFVYWVLAWISFVPLLNVMTGAFFTLTDVAPSSTQALGLKVLFLALILGLNLRGLQASASLEIGICIVKLLCLVGVPLLGIFYIDPSHFQLSDGADPLKVLSKATLIAFWGFTGVESITAPASHVSNPHKTIPRAIMVGTSLAMFIYLLNTGVIIGLVHPEHLNKAACAHTLAVEVLFSAGYGKGVAVMMWVVCLGALNAWMLVAGQVAQGAARAGLFPPFFLSENRFEAPVQGLWVSAGLCLVLLLGLMSHSLAEQIDAILDVAVVGYLGVYLMCIGAYLKGWGQLPQDRRSWQGLLVALGAAAFCLWPLWGAGVKTVGSACLLGLLGVPLRWVWRQKNKES